MYIMMCTDGTPETMQTRVALGLERPPLSVPGFHDERERPWVITASNR